MGKANPAGEKRCDKQRAKSLLRSLFTERSLTAGTPLNAASKETFGSSGISAVLKKVQVPLVDHRVCQTHLQNQKLGSRCGSWSCHTMSFHVTMS